MKKLILILSLALPSFAAISANGVWEVRTTGTDTNGGGFVTGSTGTDWSIFDNKNASGCTSCGSTTTDLSTTDAVAAGTTTITSLTANFQATIIGDLVYFAGGTGSITGTWRQVTARASTTSITIDASIAASTGMTMNIGGALLTIGQAGSNMVNGNAVFVKAGTGYTVTANIVISKGQGFNPITSSAIARIIGYTTTRGDLGRPVVTMSTNTGLKGFQFTGAGASLENFVVDCGSLGTSTGVSMEASFARIINTKVQGGCSTKGIDYTGNSNTLIDSEVTAAGSGCTTGVASAGTPATFVRNYIHDNACAGQISGGTVTVVRSVYRANTGIGLSLTASNAQTVSQSTFDANTSDGLKISGGGGLMLYGMVSNSLFTNNTGYGFNEASAFPSDITFDGNGFYGNNSGGAQTNNITSTAGNFAATAMTYHNPTITADPYVSAGTNQGLNTTTGGGAAARNAGLPGAFPGLPSTTGYPSLGAVQPTASTGCSLPYVASNVGGPGNTTIVDGGGAWAAPYGLQSDLTALTSSSFDPVSTSHSFTVNTGDTFDSDPDSLLSLNWLPQTNETAEFSFRRTDDNNRWIVRAVQNTGALSLIEKNAGTETSRGTASLTFSTGYEQRIQVSAIGTALSVYAGTTDGSVAQPTQQISYTGSFNQTQRGTKVAAQYSRFFSAWPVAGGTHTLGTPVHILAYGDSKTRGQYDTPDFANIACTNGQVVACNFSPYKNIAGYPYYLLDLIWTTGTPAWEVTRVHHGGYTIASLASAIDADLATVVGKPDYILVSAGTNDLLTYTLGTWTADLQAGAESGLSYIVNALHAKWPSAWIGLMRSWANAGDTNVTAIIDDRMIPNVVFNRPYAHLGPDERIFLKGSDNGATYTADGTHPNHAGYLLTASQWKAAMGI